MNPFNDKKMSEEYEMASRQVREDMVRREQEFVEAWPHRFVFFDSYNCRAGEGTTDVEFDRIRDWITQFAGEYGVTYVTRGDPLGISLCYAFNDADLAARFKLTFPTASHLR